jgi:hypothetical protein
VKHKQLNTNNQLNTMEVFMSYTLDQTKAFVIEDYDKKKAFTSFLPGIAGLKGIPLWSFYINRGQGLCSFGIGDKNSPIMEFFPANQAYQYVQTHGFRTFIQLDDSDIYEPFADIKDRSHIKRTMTIEASVFSVEEINEVVGLKIKVTYFGLPNENMGAIVRKVEITNLSVTRNIRLLDGIANIIPYGIRNAEYKEMGNLMKSWMEVINIENKLPFFKVRATTADTVQVDAITKGHFYMSFSNDHELIMPIVDAKLIFGENTSLGYPDAFHDIDFKASVFTQYTDNKVPCAFTPIETTLRKDEPLVIHTLMGNAASVGVVDHNKDRILSGDYIKTKQMEAAALIEEMVTDIETHTALPLFDAYLKQSFLDNLLRGGYPIILKGHEKEFIYYVYSRKHGDPEREYNFFRLAPEFYSNGEGNFRDVNQNRRTDILFNPKIGTHNIKLFMNLIQLDGYNPLVVENSCFFIEENTDIQMLVEGHVHNYEDEIAAILKTGYTPGELITLLHEKPINYITDEEDLIKSVLDKSYQTEGARHGEGFWSDHFTYNIDLVESYLKIYPDRLSDMLFDETGYRFYDSEESVQPRALKYHKTMDGLIRQYDAVIKDEEKIKRLNLNENGTNWVKTGSGKGEIYETSLMVKLLSLMVTKFSLLDPYGMGIEMEANKPGWNDALNGLPGLMGSGLAETIEVKRIAEFIMNSLSNLAPRSIGVPVEIISLIDTLRTLLLDTGINDFDYWDRSASGREAYREMVRFGITGKEESISTEQVIRFTSLVINKLALGLEKAKAMGDGVAPSFFKYQVTDYDVLTEDGQPKKTHLGLELVKVKGFICEPLPLFLEGPARYLKTNITKEEALSIHHKVLESGIYDKKLGMFKTSESLNDENFDIGRIRVFTPGWLERESVFLHMTYKYLLGLLKSGLYDEYYVAMQTNFVPFLNPEVYGRSILENSSFIASSVNPDPHVHGQGFVSRLSGSNAEVLNLWYLMMVGKGGFKYDQHLSFEFAPILSQTFFGDEGIVSFKFLSHTLITYINKTGKSTYGEDKAVVDYVEVYQDGKTDRISSANLGEKHAMALREGQLSAIKVYYK